ncbi:MAG: MarR family transcriptional regulator [Rhodoferax sp.]|uniref:MarR family winged helix-turn-helix transcriptional regulator n=1 Tax=Rhodoferax sp. TaxID=50421 RepID=UPI002ACD62E7|nr:MarR family transcriptional regulator [Rhodoferax sp.]MDZ7892800.1 MarR family transcriptional regulator [Rhodoferax sp.]
MDMSRVAGHLIRRLHQQSVQVFQTHTQAAGFELTSVQFAALNTIAEQPDIDQASLSTAISFDRATIGGVIERLERKELIRRVVCTEDRRARRLRLTPQGEALLAACRPVIDALQADILGPLSPAERDVFLQLASKALRLDG